MVMCMQQSDICYIIDLNVNLPACLENRSCFCKKKKKMVELPKESISVLGWVEVLFSDITNV